jgi:hypothetical protein
MSSRTKRSSKPRRNDHELFVVPENQEVSGPIVHPRSAGIRALARKTEEMEGTIDEGHFNNVLAIADLEIRTSVTPDGDFCFTF